MKHDDQAFFSSIFSFYVSSWRDHMWPPWCKDLSFEEMQVEAGWESILVELKPPPLLAPRLFAAPFQLPSADF